MTKFHLMYPRSVPVVIGFVMVAEHLEKTTVPLPCVVCKDTTIFVDTEFEEAICSEECTKLYIDKWAKVFLETETNETGAGRPEEPGTVPDSLPESTG